MSDVYLTDKLNKFYMVLMSLCLLVNKSKQEAFIYR